MRFALLLTLALSAPALAQDGQEPTEEASMDEATQRLLAPWNGPYGGVPPLDGVTPVALEAAVRQGMVDYRADIERIASEKKKAKFENTILPLETAGASLDRVMAVYGVYMSTMSSPEFRAVASRLAPDLAGLSDEVTQNAELFARIEAVATHKKFAKLDPESQRLTQVVYKRFVRSGAKLDEAKKERMAAINRELAGLFNQFGQNLLADEQTYIVLDDVAQLDGMSQDYIDASAAAAAERGLEGKWVVINTRSSAQPYLTFANDRALREQVWRAFVNRGDNGGDTDNNAIISQILKLRAERAQILGYETHAHWRLEDAMAGEPSKAMALMEAVWAPAVARVAEEVADQQAIADADGITIEPWDYRFYQEKVRLQRYDLDDNEVKQYLQLENLREGMFWAAGQLYGFQFEQVEGLPVNHPDVRVWEVKDAEGAHVGLWYFDPYARPGKRSGAWMNAYRIQAGLGDGQTPIVSNNSNFVKGAPGEPVLISWDDAQTLFHEFGHAIHGLLSDVTYPTLAGTSVARDYVEFPSQLNEHWLSQPEVLGQFALKVGTGEPIPEDLVAKLQEASTFNQGFATVEYLASALIDMKLHLAGSADIDADAFERDTLSALGMPKEIVMRHRTPQFAHVFSGDGYSAGYYSYLWADTLTSDAAEAFDEAGSFFDPTVAASLRRWILSVGNTIDPAEGFRNFRGRDVDPNALMRDRGFPTE